MRVHISSKSCSHRVFVPKRDCRVLSSLSPRDRDPSPICLDAGADLTFANTAKASTQNHGQVAQAVCVQALAGSSCSGPTG